MLRPLVPLVLAFALGLRLAVELPAPAALAWRAAWVALLGATLGLGSRRSAAWLLVVWALLGYARGRSAFEPSREVRAALGALVLCRGTLLTCPLGGGEGYRLLALEALGLPWRPARGRLLFYAGAGSPGRPGDRVEVAGELVPLPGPRNPGGRDQRAELARRGIGGRLRLAAPPRVLAAASFWNARRLLARIRNRAARAARTWPPPADGLFLALVLGERRRLEPAILRAFRHGGLLHVLAISGLHVALVAGAAYRLLALLGLGRGLRGGVAAALAFFQAALAGFSPPVLRAAVLAAGGFLAPPLLRRADPWNLLAAAGLITLALRPADLFRPGFALSYAAVAGILRLAATLPGRERLLPLPGEPGLVRLGRGLLCRLHGGVAATLGALWGAGPWVLHFFGALHPWVVAANLVVLPLFTGVLLAALAAALLAVVGLTPPSALAAGAPLLLDLVEALAALPAATVRLPLLPAWALGASALVLFVPRSWPWLLVPLAVALGLVCRPRPPAGPEVVLLDVGQGLCVYFGSTAGAFLYDCGSTDAPRLAEQVLFPFLRRREVRRLEQVLVSHPDRDHMSAVPQLLAEGWVRRERVRWHPERGETFRLGPFRCRVVHPPPGARAWLDRNDASAVLLVECFGTRMLFPGDVQAPGLQMLRRRRLPSVDVLLLPHHGGYAWNLRTWLRALSPRLLLLSARRSFPDRRTRSVLAELGIPVLATYQGGAIRLSWPRGELRVELFREGRWQVWRLY